MNVIKILPANEAQKIAAGEVIERPAHILKEVIENSIDAGASQIFIWIEQAGKQLIRIVDNGCGMNKHDAKLCFLPHATSKISLLEDLYSIKTYGFRGEALASISAVSKVTLTTRPQNDVSGVGYQICYQDGVFTKEEAIACQTGTDFEIKDLFYNMPVRKKFLKTDSTEWNQIINIVQAFCLSNIKIHFKLFHDNKLIINAPEVTDIKNRIAQLWDYDIAQNIIPLQKDEKNLDWLDVYGLISKHQFWKHGRSHIFFFVNNRFIKNQELSKSLLKGYLNVLPPGKFPAAFLFFNVNSDYVDINVHPKKEEVRFIKPTTVENHIFNRVKKTLEEELNNSLGQINTKFIDNNYNFEKRSIFVEQQNNHLSYNQKLSQSFFEPKKTFVDWSLLLHEKENELEKTSLTKDPSFSQKNSSMILNQKKESTLELFDHKKPSDPETDQSQKTIWTTNPFSIIGQLFKTYILIEQGDQLIMIDQHAAHERVLYEKLLNTFRKKEGTSLLFPEIINLTKDQMKAAQNLFGFFNDQGIVLEIFGEFELVIKTSPPSIAQHDLKNLILESIQFFQDHDQLDEISFAKKLNEFMHSHMACKAAVKAGDILEIRFMIQLINDLMSVDNRFICVHGRPTMWILKKFDIEKNFRRR